MIRTLEILGEYGFEWCRSINKRPKIKYLCKAQEEINVHSSRGIVELRVNMPELRLPTHFLHERDQVINRIHQATFHDSTIPIQLDI